MQVGINNYLFVLLGIARDSSFSNKAVPGIYSRKDMCPTFGRYRSIRFGHYINLTHYRHIPLDKAIRENQGRVQASGRGTFLTKFVSIVVPRPSGQNGKASGTPS